VAAALSASATFVESVKPSVEPIKTLEDAAATGRSKHGLILTGGAVAAGVQPARRDECILLGARSGLVKLAHRPELSGPPMSGGSG
jgi:hypothetical protein